MQKFSHFFKGLYLISKLSTIINNKINILTMFCSISYVNNTLFLTFLFYLSHSLKITHYPVLILLVYCGYMKLQKTKPQTKEILEVIWRAWDAGVGGSKTE